MDPHLKTLLLPSEKIIYIARRHWWFNMRALFLLNRFNKIAVTNTRILEKSGILKIHLQSIPFSQIESVDVSQTLAGRIFGYGNLIVVGSGNSEIELQHIAQPFALIKAIAAGPNRRPKPRVKKRTRKRGSPKRPRLQPGKS